MDSGAKTAFLSIWVMNADGSNKVQVTDQLFFDMQGWEPPSWSVDGKKLAFTGSELSLFEELDKRRDKKGPENAPNYDIYVVTADGSNLTRLTNHPSHDCFPVWCPTPVEEDFQD